MEFGPFASCLMTRMYLDYVEMCFFLGSGGRKKYFVAGAHFSLLFASVMRHRQTFDKYGWTDRQYKQYYDTTTEGAHRAWCNARGAKGTVMSMFVSPYILWDGTGILLAAERTIHRKNLSLISRLQINKGNLISCLRTLISRLQINNGNLISRLQNLKGSSEERLFCPWLSVQGLP